MRFLLIFLLISTATLSAYVDPFADAKLKNKSIENIQFTRFYSEDGSFSIEIPDVWQEYGYIDIYGKETRRYGYVSFIYTQVDGNHFGTNSLTGVTESLDEYLKSGWAYGYYQITTNTFETTIAGIDAIGLKYLAGDRYYESYAFIKNGYTYEISFTFSYGWLDTTIIDYIRDSFRLEG